MSNVQAQPSAETSVSGGAVVPPPAPPAAAAGASQRETNSPSAEEVARRVYELFMQDLRRDRERLGRRW